MIGKRWAEHYEIGEKLGEGREGAVHVAHDRRDQSTVALKLLAQRPQRPESFEGMSLREALHPHLVRVIDVGIEGDTAYVVQELIPGGNLRDQSFPLAPDVLTALAQQMLKALGFLHGQGMLHGDVKPENIFVQSEDPWVFKLGDFGLARRSVDVSSGVTRGTPAFMPPEVVRGEPDDERSDFYSLGIALYECAFGELPFRAPELRDLFAQHLNEEPERLSRPGSLPASLLRLLRGLLQKDPALRPRTAVAAQSLLVGEPTSSLDWVPPRLGVLVGRSEERRLLDATWVADPASLVLEGPEGIGKTRLLRDWALERQLDGVSVWSWDEQGLHGPAGAFHPVHEPGDANPTALASSLASQVESTVCRGRWLLLVDPFDQRPMWFQQSVLMFLRGVARQPTPQALVCIAGREGVQQAVSDGLRQSGLQPGPSLLLQPWSLPVTEQAVAALLGAALVGDSLVALVQEATGGVPAGVESVVRQLVDKGALRADNQGTVHLGLDVHPHDLDSDWLHAALDGLLDGELSALSLLAHLQCRVAIKVLSRLHGSPVGPAMVRLAARSLVRSVNDESGLSVEIANDGVRRKVISRLMPDETALVHDRIAAVIREHGEGLRGESLEWHTALGTDKKDAFIAFSGLQHSLEGRRPEAVIRLCEEMLGSWPLEVSPEERTQVEVELLRLSLKLGEFDSLLGRVEGVLQRAKSAAGSAHVRELWVDALVAKSQFSEALGVLDHSSEESPSMMVRRARLLLQMGRFKEALRVCSGLQRRIEPTEPVFVELVDVSVSSTRELDDPEAGRGMLEEALSREGEVGAKAWVLWMRLGQIEFSTGKMAEARKCFERAREAAVGTVDRYQLSRALVALAVTQAEAGDFSVAQDTFLQVLDMCQRLGESTNGAYVLANLGQMSAVQGFYGRALRYAEQGIEWTTLNGMDALTESLRIIKAGVLAKLGAREQVQSELDSFMTRTESDRNRAQGDAVSLEMLNQLGEHSLDDKALSDSLLAFESSGAEDEFHRLRLAMARRGGNEGPDRLKTVEDVSQAAAALKLPDLVVEAEVFKAELLAEEDAPQARERMQRTLELAQRFGFRESMWRGEALLARLADPSDKSQVMAHYRRCIDLFREMTEGLPPELSRSFLALPRQKAILEALHNL